jgi:hypothetical protein
MGLLIRRALHSQQGWCLWFFCMPPSRRRPAVGILLGLGAILAVMAWYRLEYFELGMFGTVRRAAPSRKA